MAKKYTSYKIDNIKNFYMGTISEKAGVFTYSDPIDFFDNSIMSVSVEVDAADPEPLYGGGRVLSQFAPPATTFKGTLTFAKYPGIEFMNEIMGWEKTNKNGALGIGDIDCRPDVWAQFSTETRPSGDCGVISSNDGPLHQMANILFKEPKMDFEQMTDKPGENSFEIEFVGSVSKDPDWRNKAYHILFPQFDSTKPGFNQSIFIKALTNYVGPKTQSAKVSSPTATGGTLTVSNPVLDSKGEARVFIVDSAGAETEQKLTLNSAKDSGTATLTGLTATTDYLVYATNEHIGGTTAAPTSTYTKGKVLASFSTTTT